MKTRNQLAKPRSSFEDPTPVAKAGRVPAKERVRDARPAQKEQQNVMIPDRSNYPCDRSKT